MVALIEQLLGNLSTGLAAAHNEDRPGWEQLRIPVCGRVQLHKIRRQVSRPGWHIAALVTTGAFIIHVYMGTAVVRGSVTAIIRGEVSPEWAKTHHRLWYYRMSGK